MLRLFIDRLSTPRLGLFTAKFGAGLPSLFDSRHRRIVGGKVNRFIGRDRFRGLRTSAPAPTIKEQHQRPEDLPRHGLK
jgi:hypothetical protein